MPFKDKAQRKSYQKKYHAGWYAENGDHRKQQVKNRRREIKHRYRAYKQGLECSECGLSGKDNHWALEHHHINPDEKVTTISHLVSSGYSWDKIMEEVAKCIISCANCHRLHHMIEYGEAKAAGKSPIQPKGKNNEISRNAEQVRRRKLQAKMRAVAECEKEHLSGPQPKSRK